MWCPFLNFCSSSTTSDDNTVFPAKEINHTVIMMATDHTKASAAIQPKCRFRGFFFLHPVGNDAILPKKPATSVGADSHALELFVQDLSVFGSRNPFQNFLSLLQLALGLSVLEVSLALFSAHTISSKIISCSAPVLRPSQFGIDHQRSTCGIQVHSLILCRRSISGDEVCDACQRAG